MTQYRTRLLSRKVKLLRDNLVDNAIVIDDTQEIFLKIIKIIFENADTRSKPDCLENTKEQPTEGESQRSSDSQQESKDTCSNNEIEPEVFANSASRAQLKSGYRQLYREIIKRSHPDRYEVLGIEDFHEIRRLRKIFDSAKSHAESGSEKGIIEICAQLEISISHLDASYVAECLDSSNSMLVKIIEQQENSLGWIWHMIPDDLEGRTKIVKAYIGATPYKNKKVSDTLIKDAIQSYNKDGKRKKRKPGERPPRLIR